MRLKMTRIITENVEALAKFYKELTGIDATVLSPDYVEFRSPSSVLAINSKRSMDIYGAGAAKPASNQTVILEFQVDDVDKERKRLGSLIKEFELEPITQPWGNRSMLFRDPDGNLINFFAPVKKAAA
jgi:catechol 2,3-dioxygenase-like lactoylglutathione lyase family enzyme